MKAHTLKLASMLAITYTLVTGCSGPITLNETANHTPTEAVQTTDIPTSGLLNCDPELRADMNYRPGDSITPRLYKKLSQFGCKATFEYKTRFHQGIKVGTTQEEIARRCRTEATFLYKKDFWLISRDADYKVYSASFLLDKFRGKILQTNLSGSRNVQCFATVEALFKAS